MRFLVLLICGLLLFLIGNKTARGQTVSPPASKQTPAPRESQDSSDPQSRSFELSRSVVYKKTDEYELTCDIYRPLGEGPFPAILAVRGGAWKFGSKLAMMRHAWIMVSSGYVVVAINYRHAPKHPFPAQIEDCKHAVRWMKANASKFAIDPERIGAFGYSAGGHLVALLGTTDANDGLEGDVKPEWKQFDSRVQAVAAGAAPCEFSWIDDDSQVLSYWLGGSPSEKPDAFRRASPTTFISADDPPFYFFHGEKDIVVPISTSLTMHRLLKEAGVSSQHDVSKQGGHVLTFSDTRWMVKSIEFFDSHLKKQ